MDPRIIDMLRQLNGDFYRQCASSFSDTRQAPWEGWRACIPYLRSARRDGPAGRATLSLLDLACGNGRFEVFLPGELPELDVRALAVDSCDALMGEAGATGASFRRFDALDALIRGRSWADALPSSPSAAGQPCGLCDGSVALGNRAARDRRADAGSFDAAVSFGFFHHIPSRELRERALRELVGTVRPGGIAIVSLWSFLEDDRLARKAERSHPEALEALGSAVRARCGLELAEELEEGDRFLGWQGASGLWRYCHSFGEEEVDRLAASIEDGADEVARFRSDGKSERLNAYLVLKRR